MIPTSSVVITIGDAGKGIPEEALTKVFDPFFRLETSCTQQDGGSGLGLGISRNSARGQGGDPGSRARAEGQP